MVSSGTAAVQAPPAGRRLANTLKRPPITLWAQVAVTVPWASTTSAGLLTSGAGGTRAAPANPALAVKASNQSSSPAPVRSVQRAAPRPPALIATAPTKEESAV